MPNNLIILHPADPHATPDQHSLRTALRKAGLIGGPMPQGGNHFRPGDCFLELITFLGCSPVISLGEPGATAEVCHVEVPEPAPVSRFIAGENLKPPRCPGCGYRSPEGLAIGATWEANPAMLWSCPACGKSHPAPALNWRQSAGFGRTFIRLWGIFEGEAVPGDALLETLEAVSGGTWRYFYFRGTLNC